MNGGGPTDRHRRDPARLPLPEAGEQGAGAWIICDDRHPAARLSLTHRRDPRPPSPTA